MSKKVLSVVLALVFVLSTFAVVGSAAMVEYEPADTTNKQIWSLGTPVDNKNGTYTVDVILETNYKVGPIEFQVTKADPASATLEGVVAGDGIKNYNCDVQFNDGTGIVLLVPQPTPVNSGAIQLAAGSVIAKLTYKLNGTSATVELQNNPKTSTNVGGTLIAARMHNDDLYKGHPIVGQLVEVTTASQTFGTVAAEPELAIKTAYADSGIIIDTQKTMGGKYAGVVYGFTLPGNGATKIPADFYNDKLEATNGGSITVVNTPLVKRPKSYGTGTTIQVMNSAGELKKTYCVIIFGDVDGTGQINITDFTKTLDEIDVPGTLSLTEQVLAANIKLPGRGSAANQKKALYQIVLTDATAIGDSVDAPYEFQTTCAAKHNQFSAIEYA